MSKIKCWVEAMRLRTLPVSLAGVVLGRGYAGLYGTVRPAAIALCFMVALFAQIASNFANEYYDFRNGLDKAGREGPRRGVTEGDITPGAMLAATYITLAMACVAGLCLLFYGPWWLVAVGIAVAAGALAYSTGPYPLSHHGLGEVAVILFFGIVPVNFTCWLGSGEWGGACAAGSLALGLLGANVLIVNNYRDADDDRAAGKRTLAVKAGARLMPWLYAALSLAAMALMFGQWRQAGVWWVPVVFAVALCGIAAAMRRRKGRTLTPLLGMTAVAMLLYSILFCIFCH